MSKTISRLELALAATLLFVAGEAAAGIFSNSLALLSDAAHNFADAFALGVSLYTLWLSQRPADGSKTFGYHRAGILAALINAGTLIGLGVLIWFEALSRLAAPPSVEGNVVLGVGLIALALNTAIAVALRRDSASSLNVRSAFVHMAGDALSALGVIAAGIAINLTGLSVLDPLTSLLIGAFIVATSWGIVRETVDILLEGTPRGVDVDAMVRDLLRVEGVLGVHDLHAWSISSNLRVLSAHVLTQDVSISRGASIQRDINQLLLQRYHIAHTALQLECDGCDPDTLYCELSIPSVGDARSAGNPPADVREGELK